MPELPEVETVRIGLNKLLSPSPLITGGEVLLASAIATGTGDSFLAQLQGQSLSSWQRRGKYLLGSLLGGGYLGVHLGMTGRLLVCARSLAVGKHTRVRLFLADQRELRFEDQRTFGKMWFLPGGIAVERVIPALQSMGAEPLSPEFTADYLAHKLAKSQRPIKASLLDQKVVAGLGNIYVDEALFVSRIHPATVSKDLTSAQISQLQSAIIRVLTAGLQYGGTTFSHFQDVNGKVGNYLDRAWVFRRTGQGCKVCGTRIQRLKIAGRSTHVCPTCQLRSPQT
ncbi:MAG: DNA-formamidopyrimidine glycosylase [Pseudanabaenaceae cyanobacterium]